MSFEIKEIKIKLYTNLKTKDQRLIDFTLDMLYNETEAVPEAGGAAQTNSTSQTVAVPKVVELKKDGLNTLPYFTMSVRYPLERLQKDLLTYQERVDFFFDDKKFERILFLYTKKPEESSDPDENNEIAEHNVMVMLELLFPTKFTVINNSHTSLDHVMANSSLKRMLINPLIKKYYSYLKLPEGKIYTFTRLIWLNDLMNHPLYRTFINEFHTFWLWYTREKEKVEKQMRKSVEDISKIVDGILVDIFKGIRQSFTIYDVNPKYDNTYFDIDKGTLMRTITTMTRFKIMLDKLKLGKVVEIIDMFKEAGFFSNKDKLENDGNFVDELNKEIEKTTLALKEEEENEKKAKAQENTGKVTKKEEKTESEYEDDDDIFKKISEYIESHFTSERIAELALVRFINELEKGGKRKKKESTQKTPERVLPLIKKINSALKQLSVNPIKLPVLKYENLRLYTTMPMSEVEKQLTGGVAPEYATFVRNVRSRYYGTQRKSINTYLQNLVDGSDEQSVRDFFRLFDILYKKYMRNQSGKTSFELATQLSKVLNTSLAKVETNVANWKYEIYVMADFIQGKVDDANSSKIFCPYVGEYLGVMFEFLFQMALYGKSEKEDLYRWAVDRNRVFFSLESIKQKNGEVSLELQQKPLNVSVLAQKSDGDNKMTKFSGDVTQAVDMADNIPVDEDRVNSLFVQNVISADKKITGDNGILTKLKQYLPDVDESRLLFYISKNNKKLYNVIVKWHKKEYTRDESLLEEMLSLQPVYASQNAVLNKRSNDPTIVVDTNDRIKMKTETELNNLYLAVLEKLIELEQKKAIDMGSGNLVKLSNVGGSRKMRHGKKNRHNTRKYRKK
jgi:hypothetical protein